ncbi:MAG: hypothetical protein IPM91_06425 [Bacteroidetes bacterium]|nr:hypothetical protein [Bacteroidota bacterium]
MEILSPELRLLNLPQRRVVTISKFYDDNCMTFLTTDPTQVTLSTQRRPGYLLREALRVCGRVSFLQHLSVGIDYSWYLGNSIVSSGPSPTFTANTTGVYKCYVTNPACGSKFTGTININIGIPVWHLFKSAAICSEGTSY